MTAKILTEMRLKLAQNKIPRAAAATDLGGYHTPYTFANRVA